MHVLITRPEPDASRTAIRLVALGHNPLVDPLLKVEPISFDLPEGSFAAIAATSANALRIAAGNRRIARVRELPLFVVGTHTAEAAREAGFEEIAVAEGDARVLAHLIGSKLERGSRVLHLAGEERAQDLGELLVSAGIAIEVVVLYRTRPVVDLSPVTIAALKSGSIDAVLHYSPRSARNFLALALKARLGESLRQPRHLCLSEAVAAPLAAAGAQVEVAARLDEAALLELLGS